MIGVTSKQTDCTWLQSAPKEKVEGEHFITLLTVCMKCMEVKPFCFCYGNETLGSVTAGKAADWLLSLFVDPGLKQD